MALDEGTRSARVRRGRIIPVNSTREQDGVGDLLFGTFHSGENNESTTNTYQRECSISEVASEKVAKRVNLPESPPVVKTTFPLSLSAGL